MKAQVKPFEVVIEVLDPETEDVVDTFRGTYGEATNQAHRAYPDKTLWVMSTYISRWAAWPAVFLE